MHTHLIEQRETHGLGFMRSRVQKVRLTAQQAWRLGERRPVVEQTAPSVAQGIKAQGEKQCAQAHQHVSGHPGARSSISLWSMDLAGRRKVRIQIQSRKAQYHRLVKSERKKIYFSSWFLSKGKKPHLVMTFCWQSPKLARTSHGKKEGGHACAQTQECFQIMFPLIKLLELNEGTLP